MGDRGQPTRMLAAKYGGYLTFGALGGGKESAPGQPTLHQLRQMYRLPQLTPACQVITPAPFTLTLTLTLALALALALTLTPTHTRLVSCVLPTQCIVHGIRCGHNDESMPIDSPWEPRSSLGFVINCRWLFASCQASCTHMLPVHLAASRGTTVVFC